MRRWSWLGLIVIAAGLTVGWLLQGAAASNPGTDTAVQESGGTVAGIVQDEAGPVAAARVRIRATDNLTYSDEDGRFTLDGLAQGTAVEVTAWSDG